MSEVTELHPRSISIAKLAEALSKAQGEIEPPKKTRKVDFTNNKNQRVKYNYADLSDLIEAVREPLAKNGLSVVHSMDFTLRKDQLIYGMTTYLMHSSGESVSTWYPLPDPGADIRAQEFGSALTYARRYSLSALLGVASEEDDDGASAASTAPKPAPKAQPKTSPAPKEKDLVMASEELLTDLDVLMATRAITPADMKHFIDHGMGYVKRPLPEKLVKDILIILADESFDAEKLKDLGERMASQRNKDSKDPAHFIIPIGSEQVIGKPLGKIPEATLKKILQWSEDELKKSPPISNMSQVFEIKTQIKAFLASVGVK